MRRKLRGLRTIGLVAVTLIVFVVSYSVYDNNRVAIVRQEVEIDGLPDSFEGFTILQITDLHGKRFGRNQKYLVDKINSCDYDMIAITGDMIDSYGDCDVEPFYELLDGIKNKENMFFTGGTDLAAYDQFTGQKTQFGEELEDKGCILLDHVHPIERGKDRIWVSPFNLVWIIDSYLKEARQKLETENDTNKLHTLKLQEAYLSNLKDEMEALKPDDTVIALTHYPYATDDPSNVGTFKPSFDLVIAGHYHGGQFRIPFYGALYIPDPASPRKGFFPSQDDVCGLKNWGSFQQYISKGLGAGSPIPLLRFRLFNTPEINLITLIKKK